MDAAVIERLLPSPPGHRGIPFAWHSIGPEEAKAVASVLESGGPLVHGPEVARFEEAFAEYVGARHAIATASCTAALEACCLVLGLDANAEAVTTPLTFTATANAPRRTGATVRFADVRESTFHLDPVRTFVACTPKTRAILPVHYAGLALDMEAFAQIAWANGATVIEDAAQATGSRYPDGSMVGSRPDTLCCFSFGPEKVMTTGYGGMITTGRDDLAASVRSIIRQGLERNGPFRNQHRPAMNAAMGEMQAAIGLVQLGKLDSMIERRRRLASIYRTELEGVAGVELPPWFDEETNGALFPVRLLRRQRAIERLAEEGIATSIHYKPVHLHAAWSHPTPGRGAFPNTEVASAWLLSLPLYPGLDEADVARVAEIVRRVHGG